MSSKTIINRYKCKQVGGNVTVITYENTSIMFDYGYAFSSSKIGSVDYDFKRNHIDAVFFTHFHYDHVGRFHLIPKGIPMYMAPVTKRHIQYKNPEGAAKYDEFITTINQGDKIKVGDIEVIPFLSDHSALGCFMYVIKTPDMNIVHTGDFRLHGYMAKTLYKNLRHDILMACDGNVDTVITEGTRIIDYPHPDITTHGMQLKAEKIFKKNKFAFLYVTEIDPESISAFYNAAKKYGMNFFVDKKVFEPVSMYVPFGKEIDNRFNYEDIICEDDIKLSEDVLRKGFVYLISINDNCLNEIYKFKKFNPVFIFSERQDYLIPFMGNYKSNIADFYNKAMKVCKKSYFMHTSGHASRKELRIMLKCLRPKKVIPIHTDYPLLVKLLSRPYLKK